MQVIDNFLDEGYFNVLYKLINCPYRFTWLFQKNVGVISGDTSIDHYYFVHSLFRNYDIESPFYNEFKQFFDLLNISFLNRARCLLYVNQGKQIIHDRHIDYEEPCNTALLYMNTNDGFTEFETGERVDSVKNRLLVFDGSILHSSSTPTNTKERMLISVTYR
tara:strand:- start:173 stop:661 length:489 start_codon:yes stop_codon:yes gene_type:complete